jgi:TPR repeat protein
MFVKLAKYLIDQGGDTNAGEALHWCEEAGKRRFSPGSLCVGLLYEKGIGTAADLKQAAKWFKHSAQLGNAQALLRLGEQDKISGYAIVLLASTARAPRCTARQRSLATDSDQQGTGKGPQAGCGREQGTSNSWKETVCYKLALDGGVTARRLPETTGVLYSDFLMPRRPFVVYSA